MFYFSPGVMAQEGVIDKKFISVSTFLVATTMLDVESTFIALEKNPGGREINPVMRPLVESGRLAVYAVNGAVDVALIAWSYKLKKDVNKLWWIPPLIVGTTHATAGGLNLRFVF